MNQKVYIVDDHPLTVEGLKKVIESVGGVELAGYAYKSAEALPQIERMRPDVIIFDYEIPGMNGIELFEKVKSRHSSIKSICFTMHSKPWLLIKLKTLGVNGFVSKSENPESISIALKSVLNDRNYFPDDALAEITKRNLESHYLTSKEIEVLKWIVDGITTKGIAQKMNLSENTIETYRKKLFVKLKVKNTAMLTAKAITLGLV